jgi:hypothetical protein
VARHADLQARASVPLREPLPDTPPAYGHLSRWRRCRASRNTRPMKRPMRGRQPDITRRPPSRASERAERQLLRCCRGRAPGVRLRAIGAHRAPGPPSAQASRWASACCWAAGQSPREAASRASVSREQVAFKREPNASATRCASVAVVSAAGSPSKRCVSASRLRKTPEESRSAISCSSRRRASSRLPVASSANASAVPRPSIASPAPP